MGKDESRGWQFRELVKKEAPLQVLGTINAYAALLAKEAGAKAIYLSGAGVANASFGLPDLAITSLDNVLEDARRITSACTLPLLVDIDTGFGHVFSIARTIQQMELANVAAVHIEDQQTAKRCGHRPNKKLVSPQEMGDRIKAAVDARNNPDFVIMARTDAVASEGIEAAIDRCQYYIEQGADMIFAEALATLADYECFATRLSVPILANMTEFGKTPLFTVEQLKKAKVGLILYPLSAFRAMSMAALNVYHTILNKGTQQELVKTMQTREGLYQVLNYQHFEALLDQYTEGGIHD